MVPNPDHFIIDTTHVCNPYLKWSSPITRQKMRYFYDFFSKKTTELFSVTFYHVKVLYLKQLLHKFYLKIRINLTK